MNKTNNKEEELQGKEVYKTTMSRSYLVALTALFVALCYIGTMFHIPFAIGGAKTMIHLGNVFCLLGALVIGGKRGGFAASVGMGLFDVLNGWMPYAPSTILLKFCIALITGFAFKTLHRSKLSLSYRVILSCLAGMAFNMVFAPIASYLTTKYLIGTDASVSTIMATWQSLTVLINATLATSIASSLYLALFPIIKKQFNLHQS